MIHIPVYNEYTHALTHTCIKSAITGIEIRKYQFAVVTIMKTRPYLEG
jgi:hypothetical protein